MRPGMVNAPPIRQLYSHNGDLEFYMFSQIVMSALEGSRYLQALVFRHPFLMSIANSRISSDVSCVGDINEELRTWKLLHGAEHF